MGRRILLIGTGLVSLALVGCASTEGPQARQEGGDPHAGLNCAACHEFTLGSETRLAAELLVDADSITVRAPAPEARCSNSGCHQDGGPRAVSFRSVTFEHRDHGGDTLVAMSCAGCHGHETGGQPITASVDACSLCHLSDQSAGNHGECRVCHSSLEHAGTTSQGLSIPHEGLAWIEGGCVRCHYDVTSAPTGVSVLSCRACHDSDAVVARGIGEDLHVSHTGVGCTSCHAGEAHRIQAMSTAIALECAQCHLEAHAVAVSTSFPDAGTCNDCHGGAHTAEQRMVLGLLPGVEAPQPSEKFMDGLTCRSCHVPDPRADAGTPVGGTEVGCEQCHRREYRHVLDWWNEGAADRLRQVRNALGRAESAVGGSPEAMARLDSARVLVGLVEGGGAIHNLNLSHRLLVQASDQ
ncbi:MAG TPA: cytochrome c3 family protein, partial [Longimicrobiales bacterium]|nr:cytochrome c3 family protein [Longimicrobiales bacterium]